jgi:predicted nuclease of predicted toxin-antitoxin system
MKFLANENFPFPSIQHLRKAGYEVVSILEDDPGIADYEVIVRAIIEELIILTFDKDYGEIIFNSGKEKPPAVVFFRFKGNHPEIGGKILIDLLENEKLEIENKFTVIEEENVRQRSYK